MASGFYPHNPLLGQDSQTDVTGVTGERAFGVRLSWTAAQAVAASTTGVHAAITDTGSAQLEVDTGITSPPCPRNVTATAGGTAGDIGAIQVTVRGTNYKDEDIEETLPAFTANSAGTVVGSKAFKTVTDFDLPAHDGTGATTSIGWGDKLGLPFKLARNTVEHAHLGNVREGTAPTVAVSSSAIESNTVDLNSALNGSAVEVYLLVP